MEPSDGKGADLIFTFTPRREDRSLLQELAVRALVSLAILAFHHLYRQSVGERPDPVIRALAILGVLVNGPYYLAGRTGRWPSLQAYIRLLMDIALITGGLSRVGGLAASGYLAIYAIVAVYAGMTVSSAACLVAIGAGTAGYLVVALLQAGGWFPEPKLTAPNAWGVAAFNLLVLNIVGVLTALLAATLRKSRRQLAVLNQDLQLAYDELARLTAEIQRAARFQALGEVVAGVAHEIRNALTIALVHVEMVRRHAPKATPDVSRQLDNIKAGCDTAMRIVRNALELAQRPTAEKVAVSVPEVVQRLVELKGYDLRRKRISLRVDFPSEFPRVLVVPLQLQQILLNLITNAEDALQSVGGSRVIEITGRSEPGQAVIEIRDSGPGIPPDVLPRIFEPFYTTKRQGTGLGLTISAGIIRELGGELAAENLPERGAVFRLTLPTAKPASAQAPGQGGRHTRIA